MDPQGMRNVCITAKKVKEKGSPSNHGDKSEGKDRIDMQHEKRSIKWVTLTLFLFFFASSTGIHQIILFPF